MAELTERTAAPVSGVAVFPYRLTLHILTVLIFCNGTAWGSENDAARSPGTVEMAKTLADIISQADPPEAYYTIGYEQRLAAINAQLDKAFQAKDVSQQISLRVQRAYEQLKQGETEQALAGLKVIEDFFKRPDFRATPSSIKLINSLMATAYLRLGEQQNCLARHGPDSCLLPIRGEGVHEDKQGSTKAIDYLLKLLEIDPSDAGSRWLLNVAHMTLGTYPQNVPQPYRIAPSTFTSPRVVKRFKNIATEAGVDVPGLGGGAIMDDFDNDGDLDIVASSWGLKDNIRFLVNQGNLTFVDQTVIAGLEGLVGGINLFQADYDRDGFLDIFVCRGAWLRENGRHPNSLLRNNGDGTFSDVTREAGLFALHPTHSASWGDFNLDGWIDLFVANESSTGSRNPCQLYRNNMDGTFTDIAANAGVNLLAFSKAAVWGDVNNDGLLDLYVSNLMQPNVLFLNKGKQADWTFEEVSNRAGVASHNPSFPTWFWDYNNDGHLDIFVAPFPGFLSDSLSQIAGGYLGARPTGLSPALFKNNGKGQFSNVAEDIGLSDMMLAMGANFGDLDNDGFPDFYIGTGEPSLNTLVPNRMYRNDQGRSFQNVTFSGGFGHLQKGHGIAFGDIDQDGDQDVYAVMGGAYAGDIAYNALYINPGNDNAWITLKLEGTTSNRDAIGARIAIFTRNPDGKAQRFHAHVSSGGSFGASSLQQELGIGNAATIERVEIRWPGQKNPQTLTTLQCNTAYHIVQGDDKPKTLFTAAGNRNQN